MLKTCIWCVYVDCLAVQRECKGYGYGGYGVWGVWGNQAASTDGWGGVGAGLFYSLLGTFLDQRQTTPHLHPPPCIYRPLPPRPRPAAVVCAEEVCSNCEYCKCVRYEGGEDNFGAKTEHFPSHHLINICWISAHGPLLFLMDITKKKKKRKKRGL